MTRALEADAEVVAELVVEGVGAVEAAATEVEVRAGAEDEVVADREEERLWRSWRKISSRSARDVVGQSRTWWPDCWQPKQRMGVLG